MFHPHISPRCGTQRIFQSLMMEAGWSHESPRDQVWDVVAGWQNIRRIEIPASTHGFQVNSNHRTWTTKCLWIWDTNSCCTGQVVYVCIHGNLTYRLMCNIMALCMWIVCIIHRGHEWNSMSCKYLHISSTNYESSSQWIEFLCNDDTISTHVIS